MGTDIHGAIEVDHRHYTDDSSWWRTVGRVGPLVGRSYDAFNCLFGVRGYAGFEPVAEGRGLPEDASRTTEEDAWGHSHTHVYADELEDIDWDEEAAEFDERYSVVGPDGEVRGKAGHYGWMDTVFTDAERERIEDGERVAIDPPEDAEFTLTPMTDVSGVEEISDLSVKRRRMQRRDSLSGAWEWLLFDHIETLTDRYGAENVRLVVWFDS